MDPKKKCPRCQRLIDAASRVCPFCNQEQVIETLDGGQREVRQPSPAATSPIAMSKQPERNRQILMAVGGSVLLVGMFFIGWIVYALGQPDSRKPAEEETRLPAPAERVAPDITLVADGSAVPDIERAYTSRLSGGLNEDLPEEFQRRDATALPIAVYQRVVEEERRREQERRAELVDPREVTEAARPRARPSPEAESLPADTPLGEIPGTAGPVTEQPASPQPGVEQRATAETPTTQAAPVQTKPRPLSQPLPRIVSRVPGTIHVSLTIGPDGEVSGVQVIQGMSGITEKVVSAVNRWKFQPATVDGRPVQSTYRVEIVVKPNR